MSNNDDKDKGRSKGSLRDQLLELEIEPSLSPEARARQERAANQGPVRKRLHQETPPDDDGPEYRHQRAEQEPPAQHSTADEDLSPEEIFARAVDDMGPEEVYRGKYMGQVDGLPPRAEPTYPGLDPDAQTSDDPEESENLRRVIEEARRAGDFARAIGDVEPLDGKDKYYKRQPRQRVLEQPDEEEEEEPRPYSSEPPPDLSTPPLPKSGDGLHNLPPLVGSQQSILKRFKRRSRREEVQEINLRGDNVNDALRQLELFVHKLWKDREPFCRVIHGRGSNSQDGPAIKPAVLHWLEGPGFRYVVGYAPERKPSGDYGSVIVELSQRPGS